MRHDPDLPALGAEVPDEIVRRGPRTGEDAVGAARRPAEHRARVPVRETVRKELREEEVDEVVDGHHHAHPETCRQDVVRCMVERRTERRQPPRETELLRERVARRPLVDPAEVLRQRSQRGVALARREQEVLVAGIERREAADQAGDVGSDPEVGDLARVERDARHARAPSRSASTAWKSPARRAAALRQEKRRARSRPRAARRAASSGSVSS